MAYQPKNPNGSATSANSTPVVIASDQSAVPVSLASVPTHAVTLASTTITGTVAVTGTFYQATQPVSLASVPTHGVTGTFWQATQPVSIASMPSTPVTGTFWQATQPVSLASVPSHPVTNAGTFAVQATLAAETTKVIGTINLAAAQTLATVTNLSQLGGVAINMNTGVRATGTQRVTIATNDIVQVKNTPDATATYSPTNATTAAYAASLIAKASAGNLYAITGYNSKTSTQFIQVHDSATLPADTAVPKLLFIVPALSNFSFDLASWGRYFAAGITICNSSTGPTKTIGSADCWFDIQYK